MPEQSFGMIRYAVQSIELGWILIAATERGICSVQLSDEPEPAIAQLHSRFPDAQFQTSDPAFDPWVATVVKLIQSPWLEWDLPLDVQGTAFQQQVWQTLRTIPPGKTATYTEIAQRIGNPKAVRAVARACAMNEIAVLIPCHRVLGRNGALTGYRWGVDRKQALLTREAAARV